jgi:HAD superfamily hydrolase (TIGR01509 family)
MGALDRLAGVRGVIFDMDGVIIDSGAHHRAAWDALLAELQVRPEGEYWRLTIGRPAEEAVCLLLGKALPPEEARRLATRKREHYAGFARRGTLPVPGAPDFIGSIRRRGLPVALATSATLADVDRLLGGLALRRLFDAVVTAEDVRLGKPDPEVYVKAALGIAIDPVHCVVFEDSLVGVQAARTAGMQVIGVTTAHSEAELREVGALAAIPSFEGLAWPA